MNWTNVSFTWRGSWQSWGTNSRRNWGAHDYLGPLPVLISDYNDMIKEQWFTWKARSGSRLWYIYISYILSKYLRKQFKNYYNMTLLLNNTNIFQLLVYLSCLQFQHHEATSENHEYLLFLAFSLKTEESETKYSCKSEINMLCCRTHNNENKYANVTLMPNYVL